MAHKRQGSDAPLSILGWYVGVVGCAAPRRASRNRDVGGPPAEELAALERSAARTRVAPCLDRNTAAPHQRDGGQIVAARACDAIRHEQVLTDAGGSQRCVRGGCELVSGVLVELPA